MKQKWLEYFVRACFAAGVDRATVERELAALKKEIGCE